MLDLAQTGQTTEPLLAAILTTQRINRLLGTALEPWDLDRVPEEYATACDLLERQLPKYLEHEQKVKASDEAFKREKRKRQ